MNIVIISDYASRELFIIEQIIQKYPETVIVQPVYSAQKNGQSNGLRLVKRVRNFANAVSWKLNRELWNRKLYPNKSYPEIPNKIHIPSHQLHNQEGAQIIRQLHPDVLITCRSPIIKPDIIQIPNIAAVNIHYGLAPHYRGNDTLFWPLYYGDYEKLGGCIHYLTEGIDTGNILAEVYPELNSNDGEIAVDLKTTKLLAKAMLHFLEAVEKGESDLDGKPQNEKGRNFNSRDRRPGISLKYLAKRAVGLKRPPVREEKIVTYF